MYPFQWKHKVAVQESDTCLPPRILSFDAERIVHGITFHLMEEGTATAVHEESSRSTIEKLSQRGESLMIAADQWAAMANVQRLNWLLTYGHVAVKLTSSGTALLTVR